MSFSSHSAHNDHIRIRNSRYVGLLSDLAWAYVNLILHHFSHGLFYSATFSGEQYHKMKCKICIRACI